MDRDAFDWRVAVLLPNMFFCSFWPERRLSSFVVLWLCIADNMSLALPRAGGSRVHSIVSANLKSSCTVILTHAWCKRNCCVQLVCKHDVCLPLPLLTKIVREVDFPTSSPRLLYTCPARKLVFHAELFIERSPGRLHARCGEWHPGLSIGLFQGTYNIAKQQQSDN